MLRKTKTSRPIGIVEGFRSGLEDKIAAELASKGVNFSYEKLVIPYLKPAKTSKYTPDFLLLDNGIIVESKGRFVTADRQKHLLVKAQHPKLDIRFVFSNSKSRISKISPTTYAMWATKHGFKFADRSIPQEWIDERGPTVT